MSRTPSGWHDDARGRGAGHDEMQLWVFREWSRQRGRMCHPRVADGNFWIVDEVLCEFPLAGSRGDIVAFVDVAVRLRRPDNNHEPERWLFKELKPDIKSAGAVLRQIHALEAAAESWAAGQVEDRGYSIAPKCLVSAAVYDDDPKADMLREIGARRLYLVPREVRL